MSDPNEIDLYALVTGTPLEEAVREPSVESVIKRQLKVITEAGGRQDEVFALGFSDEEDFWVSEHERNNHMLVLGTTQQGKSRFLQSLTRHDIDRLISGERPTPLCFVDATPAGKNAKAILSYCAEVGFKKVLYIDPVESEKRGKYPVINPLSYFDVEGSANNLQDAFRSVFGVGGAADTMRIERYLPALWRVLGYAGLTLGESLYFTSIDSDKLLFSPGYRHKRLQVFAQAFGSRGRLVEKYVSDLELAYANEPVFERTAASSARRLEPIFDSKFLHNVLSHREGVDFAELITDGWVILVNADTGKGWDTLSSRLLVTIVINEIIYTIKRLNHFKPYHLYIDEASRFFTHKLQETLKLFRNIGASATLSFQHLGQVRDPQLLSDLKNNTDIKVLFYISDNGERMKALDMMYGGSLEVRDVSFNLASQKKRQAVFKILKQPPKVGWAHQVPDPKTDPSKLLDKIFRYTFYKTEEEIKQDTVHRFEEETSLPTARAKEIRNDTRRKKSKNNLPPVPPPALNNASDSTAGVQHGDTHQGWENLPEQPVSGKRATKKDGQGKADKASTKATPKRS